MNKYTFITGDNYIGADYSSSDKDRSVIHYWRRPSRLRKFMRSIGIDRSKWELKLIKEVYVS